MRARTVTKGRESWRVVGLRVVNGRVSGDLVDGIRVVREGFNVKLTSRYMSKRDVVTDRFSVDIGTGSGVKIEFELSGRK